jgi:hypothetical protein
VNFAVLGLGNAHYAAAKNFCKVAYKLDKHMRSVGARRIRLRGKGGFGKIDDNLDMEEQFDTWTSDLFPSLIVSLQSIKSPDSEKVPDNKETEISLTWEEMESRVQQQSNGNADAASESETERERRKRKWFENLASGKATGRKGVDPSGDTSWLPRRQHRRRKRELRLAEEREKEREQRRKERAAQEKEDGDDESDVEEVEEDRINDVFVDFDLDHENNGAAAPDDIGGCGSGESGLTDLEDLMLRPKK